MGSERSPFLIVGGALRAELRVQPGASRTEVEGLVRSADGAAVLLVRVGASPEGGKANAAVIKLLAKTWRVPKSALTIVTGQSARRKSLQIAGDPADRLAALQSWLTGISRPKGS